MRSALGDDLFKSKGQQKISVLILVALKVVLIHTGEFTRSLSLDMWLAYAEIHLVSCSKSYSFLVIIMEVHYPMLKLRLQLGISLLITQK